MHEAKYLPMVWGVVDHLAAGVVVGRLGAEAVGAKQKQRPQRFLLLLHRQLCRSIRVHLLAAHQFYVNANSPLL